MITKFPAEPMYDFDDAKSGICICINDLYHLNQGDKNEYISYTTSFNTIEYLVCSLFMSEDDFNKSFKDIRKLREEKINNLLDVG